MFILNTRIFQNNISDAKDEEQRFTSTEKSGKVDNLIGDTLGSASGIDYFAKEGTQKSDPSTQKQFCYEVTLRNKGGRTKEGTQW